MQGTVPLGLVTTDILTPREFADRLKIGRSTLFDWLRLGVLVPGVHYFKYGRVLRFLWNEKVVASIAEATAVPKSAKKQNRLPLTQKGINWDYYTDGLESDMWDIASYFGRDYFEVKKRPLPLHYNSLSESYGESQGHEAGQQRQLPVVAEIALFTFCAGTRNKWAQVLAREDD